MSQAVLRPNLTKKFQWEVSQIADKERSLAPLYRWFKCKLKPPKKALTLIILLQMNTEVVGTLFTSTNLHPRQESYQLKKSASDYLPFQKSFKLQSLLTKLLHYSSIPPICYVPGEVV